MRGPSLVRRSRVAAVALAVALAAAGCGTPGSSEETTGGGTGTGGAPQVRTDGFEDLGPVTMTVWTYETQKPGPRTVLEKLTANFEQQYPNVDVKLVFKEFGNIVSTVPRALRGEKGPDVTQGNQGYQTDGALVKAGLILPLDDYVEAYGWDDWYSESTWSMFRWSDDGTDFGTGKTYGVAAQGQSVATFYNAARLRELGYDPENLPETFDEFSAMLADIRQKLPADQPVIQLGNQEGFGALHMFGGIASSRVDPEQIRDWIYHREDASFDTPEMAEALDIVRGWAQDGYFNDDYNAVGYDTAAADFAKGEGVFFIGGNWEAGVIEAGLGADAGAFNIPGTESGSPAAIGSTSGPWHISAKYEQPDVAAAWLDYIVSSPEAIDLWYENQQIPALTSATPPEGDPFLGQVTSAWQELVNADGLLLYPDWASPTMLQTMSAQFQLLLAGKASGAEVAAAIQADWEKFDPAVQ